MEELYLIVVKVGQLFRHGIFRIQISRGATFTFATMRMDIRPQQERDRFAASTQHIQINVRRLVSE